MLCPKAEGSGALVSVKLAEALFTTRVISKPSKMFECAPHPKIDELVALTAYILDKFLV